MVPRKIKRRSSATWGFSSSFDKTFRRTRNSQTLGKLTRRWRKRAWSRSVWTGAARDVLTVSAEVDTMDERERCNAVGCSFTSSFMWKFTPPACRHLYESTTGCRLRTHVISYDLTVPKFDRSRHIFVVLTCKRDLDSMQCLKLCTACHIRYKLSRKFDPTQRYAAPPYMS